MTFGITIFTIATNSITKHSIMMLSITIVTIAAHSIMILSMMTLSNQLYSG